MSIILVAQAEPKERPMLMEQLHPLNMEVRWVTTFEEAREVLENYDCALVISDLPLGTKKTGLDLWQYCKKECPKTPFLLVTQYMDGLFEELVNRQIACPPILDEPYSSKGLQSIRTLLDAERPAGSPLS